MRTPRLALALLALALTPACLTPMKADEIERLTTCTGTDLDKVRKNLLLAGYEIKSAGANDLTTEYKQVGGYGRDRRMRRVTVVKVDDKTLKFRVRNKDVRVDKENQGAALAMGGDKKKQGSTVVIDLSQPVETTNETDQSYYEESRSDYAALQREVCG